MGSLSRLTAPVYGGGNMTLREYIIFWQETYDRYRHMKEGVKHRKCFTPSFIVILFSAIHSSWPNAGAAAFLLLCEGNFGT